MNLQQLAKNLNEDLSKEFQAVLLYTVHSQVLKGAAYQFIIADLEKHASEELKHAVELAKWVDYYGCCPEPKAAPAKLIEDCEDALIFILSTERDAIARYKVRIEEALSCKEFGLADALADILQDEQQHQIDLCTALGMKIPAPGKIVADEDPEEDSGKESQSETPEEVATEEPPEEEPAPVKKSKKLIPEED